MANPSLKTQQTKQKTVQEQGAAENVTITVGSVKVSSSDAGWDFQSKGEIYTDYMIFNRYERDGHKYMAGITSPDGFNGQSVAFFQLANLSLLWICDWTAERLNAIPEIPDPDVSSQDSNWILLDGHAELKDIKMKPDGVSTLYRISGTYIYGHKNPSDTYYSHMRFGYSPEYSASPTRTIEVSKLSKDIAFTSSAGGARAASPGNPGGKS